MIQNLDRVSIVDSSLSESKTFFQSIGFALEDEADLQGDWISAMVGLEDVHARYAKLSLSGSNTKVELMEYVTPPSGSDADMSKANQLGLRHIAFEVADIDAMAERLRELGVELLSDVQTYEPTGKKLVYFKGPDDILMELAQYPACR